MIFMVVYAGQLLSYDTISQKHDTKVSIAALEQMDKGWPLPKLEVRLQCGKRESQRIVLWGKY